jgi:hypothetical protein
MSKRGRRQQRRAADVCKGAPPGSHNVVKVSIAEMSKTKKIISWSIRRRRSFKRFAKVLELVNLEGVFEVPSCRDREAPTPARSISPQRRNVNLRTTPQLKQQYILRASRSHSSRLIKTLLPKSIVVPANRHPPLVNSLSHNEARLRHHTTAYPCDSACPSPRQH